jgi:hypothetical protein
MPSQKPGDTKDAGGGRGACGAGERSVEELIAESARLREESARIEKRSIEMSKKIAELERRGKAAVSRVKPK